jgi:hypothetical protein
MEKINDLEYQENDIVITFTPSAESKFSNGERYVFEVEGDPNLTATLLPCIKEQEVSFKGILHCAIELFRILRKRDFTPLPSAKQKQLWHKEFRKLYRHAPQFSIAKPTTGTKEVSATLINVEIPTSGTARDPQVAKALALKEHFAMMATAPLRAY